VTCEYLEDSGCIRIVSSKPIVIYDPALLDDERWQNSVWYNPQFARVGTPLQPGRLNSTADRPGENRMWQSSRGWQQHRSAPDFRMEVRSSGHRRENTAEVTSRTLRLPKE
jgi:hypothetical protein